MDPEPPAINDILLADDNKEDCLLFEKAIMDIDVHTRLTTVTNGEELLQLLSHYIPQVLFLDLEMPYKNGIQCLQYIRENKTYERLPIVVFSSTSRMNNIQVAYGFGANLFFTKPKVYEELIASLYSILKMDWSDPDAITEQYFQNNQYQPFRLKF
jgi:CheY-like chemotaxis protein